MPRKWSADDEEKARKLAAEPRRTLHKGVASSSFAAMACHPLAA